MPIDLSRYMDRHVALTLTSGHVGYGKLEKRDERTYLTSAQLTTIEMGEINTVGLNIYLDTQKGAMKQLKKVQNTANPTVMANLLNFEISPEQVSAVLDIEDIMEDAMKKIK